MKGYKRVWIVLKRTGALKIFGNFIFICLVASFIFRYCEPDIHTIRDGLWYCFVASTTIGFGDLYATTVIGRITTIFVALNGIFVFAMMTGVVVTYYNEYLVSKKNESLSLF